MATTKPTIVLIPGAWHTPAYFNPLRNHLEAQSYPTISHQLPSVGCTDSACNHTAQTDAEFVRKKTLLPLLDAGKRVMLAMHSYGGHPGSAAAYGLSEEERHKEGLKGGVMGLVFMAGFVIPVGKSVGDMKPPPLAGQTFTEDGQCLVSPEGALQSFYNTCQPPLTTIESHLRPISVSVLTTPVKAAAHESPFFKNRMSYIHCTEDRAIPLDLQRRMVAEAGIELTMTVETDHTPFLGMVNEVADFIMDTAEDRG